MKWVDEIKTNANSAVLTIVIVLLITWMIGFFVLQMSDLIHILLVTAIVMVVFLLIKEQHRNQDIDSKKDY